jgi:hypothetical protein
VVQAGFVVGLHLQLADLQPIKSLNFETVDYRFEPEAGQFQDDVVYGVSGPGREAEFAVPSLGARTRQIFERFIPSRPRALAGDRLLDQPRPHHLREAIEHTRPEEP